MENIPLLKAKFMLPAIPAGALYCDRIKTLNIAGRRAVIITAPAGYGKTTAVLLSLRKYRASTHWYRLDKEDSSLSVFFAGLINTLFGHDEKGSDSQRSLTSIGNILEEYPLLSAVVCQDVWSCYAGGPTRYLVFDDFQNAAGNEALGETIRYLIANMPPNVHIIVISRVNTGIRTEKPALSGELALIGERDLLFSREETNMLFSDLGVEDVSKEYISEAYEYTEGWIAGITLLIHTVHNLNSGGKQAWGGDRQDIFRYLLGEAFAGVDKDKIHLTVPISLFSDFTCEDLTAVFQMERPSEIIEWLERSNLYIQKTDTDPPSYRFHSLFRDALRHILDNEFTREEITGFHLTAAGRFEKTGRYKAAIQHYLSAQDTQKAISVATAQGQILMDRGDIDAAAELVHTLPEQYVHDNAALLMITGASLINTETDRSFSCMEKALPLAVKKRELMLAINIQGIMISVCAQRSDFKSIKNIVAQVPMFRSLIISKQARNMLLMSLFTKAVVTDNVKMAKALCGIVGRIDAEVDLWEYSNHITKATLYGIDGDFHEAEKIILQIVNHPTALRNDKWRSLGLYICVNLAVLMRETDLALKLIDNLTSIGEKYASWYAAGSAAYYSGIMKYQSRDLEGAILAVQNAEHIFVENQSHIMAAASRVMQTAWLAEREADADYSEQADAELNTLSALSSYHGLLELAETLAAVRHFQKGSYDKAEDLLKTAYKGAQKNQAAQGMCGVAMHLSALYHDIGNLKREEKYLKFFGKTAAQNGYLYFREMSYAALVRVCARCIEKKVSVEHMVRIINVYFGSAAADQLLKEPSKAAAAPDAFIALYPVLNQNKPRSLRVNLFGAFSLTVDGREISSDVWKTRKINGVFKYILANPDRTVSRDMLAAAFWPDSNPKAAYSSLRVALFELRKILSSFDMGFDSKDALIAEDKKGFYVCRPEYVESDAGAFSALYEKIKTSNFPPEEARALLRQMVDMYNGDFLADDIYDEWADVSREHYRSIYIEASHKLAEHYYNEGDAELTESLLIKHMKIDPFDETACRMLIRVYVQSGRKNQASSLRRQFEKRFKAEMGVDPEI